MTARQPAEFYGHSIHSATDWSAVLRDQRCPFLQKTCVKQRKSDPQQTIGACSVYYAGRPLLICPHRFLESQRLFLDVILLLSPAPRYVVVPELAMPGGMMDYFVVGLDGESIVDYAGLEIQTLDTTASGGIWEARQDLLAGARLRKTYEYGINWKMSAKTILMQLHHKAEALEMLGKKLVLVMQQPFYQYIAETFQTAHLRAAAPADSMHFHLYAAVWLNDRLRLHLAERRSTNAGGVERMLKLGDTVAVSEQEVLQRIRAKLPFAVQLNTE